MFTRTQEFSFLIKTKRQKHFDTFAQKILMQMPNISCSLFTLCVFRLEKFLFSLVEDWNVVEDKSVSDIERYRLETWCSVRRRKDLWRISIYLQALCHWQLVKLVANLIEDPRQTDYRWQQLFQTKTVLQIPQSLRPPDRNEKKKCSYQTQIKKFYRDIHDGGRQFYIPPGWPGLSSGVVWPGCQVCCRILYFSKKFQPQFIFHFVPKYFPIVWKLALMRVVHRKALIFTFPKVETVFIYSR